MNLNTFSKTDEKVTFVIISLQIKNISTALRIFYCIVFFIYKMFLLSLTLITLSSFKSNKPIKQMSTALRIFYFIVFFIRKMLLRCV